MMNIVNKIKGLGGNLPEDEIVKKILRTLSKPYISKVSTIEESQNQNIYTREYLYGSLHAFEMREFGSTSTRTKTAFPLNQRKMRNLMKRTLMILRQTL